MGDGMKYVTYMVLFETGYLYTGCTGNLERRNRDRNRRLGLRFDVVFREAFKTREAALAREAQIKGWSRAKKEALIHSQASHLQRLSMRPRTLTYL